MPSKLPAPSPPSNQLMCRRNERGFALVIALSLMAFVLLLLLSMTSLVQVESRSSASALKQMRAEQNALLALDIAIGQLQKYAGPDQRTTARANLTNGSDAANAQWIGVYGSAARADYAAPPETIPSELTDTNIVSPTGSPAQLLNWLVSGSETTSFSPAWVSGDVGDMGQILNAPDDIKVTPNGAIDGLTAATAATDTTLTMTDASGTTTARLLVGQNSVISPLNSAGIPVEYVVAPTVDIQGNDGVANRYAWWVSDEGMKARVNLPIAGSDSSLSAAEKQKQRRDAFSNSPREAIELMALNSDPALDAPRIDTLYPADESVTSIITPNQTALRSSDSDAMSEALKYRFHDLTTNSLSVLSDTYAGGLKRDLSILLARDPSSGNTTDNYVPNAYAAEPSDPTFDTNTLWVRHSDAIDGFTENYGMPTWKHLRTYYQTRVPTTGGDAYKLDPILPAHDKSNAVPGNVNGVEDHVGVAPIITYYSMGFAMGLNPQAGNPSAGIVAVAGDEFELKLYPLVVLWNPYNFTIKASQYEAGMYASGHTNVSISKAPPGTDDWTEVSDLLKFTRLPGTPNKNNFTRFRLNCPDIPPGESLIFSLPYTSSGDAYNQQNMLENIEPESTAYVTVPFTEYIPGHPNLAIKPGEEDFRYKLNPASFVGGSKTYYSAFANGSGASVNLYLGEPVDYSVLEENYLLDPGRGGDGKGQLLNPSRSGDNSPIPDRRWYNTHQAIGWDNSVGTDPLQSTDLLTYEPDEEPVYAFLAQALFSGAGSNARFNTNQFMFTTRWIAQGNMRATRTGRSMRDSNFNVLYIATAGSTSLNVNWQKFTLSQAESERASAGSGHDASAVDNAPVDAMLFDFPYEDQDLFSIGQLQHANLSFYGDYPAYPIGNSIADYHLHSQIGSQSPNLPVGHQLVRIDKPSGANNTPFKKDMNAYYDISYLLNRTLWDQYYFSTVPATGAVPDSLANPRYLRNDPSIDLQDPDKSASALMMAGGFNINSTSEQAWRAVLGGSNQLSYDPANPDAAATTSLNPSFPRHARPSGDDDVDDPWKGYRTLDENQIAQLARNIVTEIRNRGPFVSVADFVNRRLYDNPNTDDGSSTTGDSWEHEDFKGALQAAIDRTETTSAGNFAANDANDTFWSTDEMATGSGSDGRHNQGTQYSMGYYGKAMLEGGDTPTKPTSNRAIFAPKHITQADILAKIGAGLTARSDTFTIRTYGETVNPVTQKVDAHAWCEAVVQRLPEYVDDSIDPEDSPPPGSINQKFGRQFKIISFQWLSSNDI